MTVPEATDRTPDARVEYACNVRWQCGCGRFLPQSAIHSEDRVDPSAYYGVTSRTWANCKRCGEVEDPRLVEVGRYPVLEARLTLAASRTNEESSMTDLPADMIDRAASRLWRFDGRTSPWPPSDEFDRRWFRNVAREILEEALDGSATVVIDEAAVRSALAMVSGGSGVAVTAAPDVKPTFNPAYQVARCGQLSTHAPHVVEHGPDQPRNCPGTGPVPPEWCS